jgi:NADPH2:quinone reductase
MRAIRISAFGDADALEAVADAQIGEPGTGEVRVAITAAGVNFIDIYHRTGLYPLQPPFTPGTEAAGIVDAVGAEVTGFSPGDRVAYASVLGSYAEQALVPAERLVPVPEGLELTTAAALMLQGMTAHYLVTDTFALGAGHRTLIHAAAGGVGRLLVQLAKRRGATVYATVSTQAKADLVAALGADAVIRYDSHDVAAEVARLTDGVGVDVVYDSVGKATFEGSLASLRRRGLLVSFGNASGAVADFAPLRLSRGGSLYLTRPSLADYIVERAELLARTDELFALVKSADLDVLIYRQYQLAEASQAHRDLAGRDTVGKLLLIP